MSRERALGSPAVSVAAGNIPTHRIPDQPGEWQIEGTSSGGVIWYGCPLRPGQSCRVPVVTGTKIDKHWLWDGNTNAPTIEPSINCLAHKPGDPTVPYAGCGWHGKITKGVFK